MHWYWKTIWSFVAKGEAITSNNKSKHSFFQGVVEPPEACLYLTGAFSETPQKKDLLLPLLLTYLISARLSFTFPMKEAVSRQIDKAFDDLIKELPLNSRGILYYKDATTTEIRSLLSNSCLVLTDHPAIQETAEVIGIPSIRFVLNASQTVFSIKSQHRLSDRHLLPFITSCVGAVNRQSIMLQERLPLYQVSYLPDALTEINTVLATEDSMIVSAS